MAKPTHSHSRRQLIGPLAVVAAVPVSSRCMGHSLQKSLATLPYDILTLHATSQHVGPDTLYIYQITSQRSYKAEHKKVQSSA